MGDNGKEKDRHKERQINFRPGADVVALLDGLTAKLRDGLGRRLKRADVLRLAVIRLAEAEKISKKR
jgi:hypothetical protein